jgi:hypothetical protein
MTREERGSREEKREEVEKRSATYRKGRRLHGRREITKATLRSDFKKAKLQAPLLAKNLLH